MSVFWITGLSGAGKTTLAREIVARLRAHRKPTVMLDGDELRNVFGSHSANIENYGRERRLVIAFQYSRLCQLIARQDLTVVIATISMFKEIYKWNRENLPGYFEVYLRVPMHELRRRDAKGIYQGFDSGELTNIAGVDLLVDEPEAADYVSEFVLERSAKELADELFTHFNKD